MKVRVPLLVEVSADDVDNAINDNEWTVEQAVVDDIGKPIFKRWSLEDGTAVQYICDGNVDVAYILVSGERAEATAKHVNKQLSSWSIKDIRAYAKWASAREDMVIALHLIGLIGSDEFDGELYGHLERGFTHEDPQVRKAAVLAASYLHWPQVTTMAHQLATADPEDDVREAAAELVPPHLLEGGAEA